MGKATIISNLEDGKYSIRVDYRRVEFESKIDRKDSEIANLTALIPTLEGKAQQLAQIQLKAAQAAKEKLELDMPEDVEIDAWCADFTVDLSGEVATCEIPNEFGRFREDVGHINIRPGYDGQSDYDRNRDGQLTPFATMGVANSYLNRAILPGWQKWKPTYRYGVITDIDRDNNHCDIDLNAAESTQQDINVNQTDTLSDVPFEYITCNHVPFQVGDEVLIQFRAQDWNDPVVIGFREEPKPCEFIFYLRPTIDGHTLLRGGWRWFVRYQDIDGNIQFTTTYSVRGNIDSGADPQKYWIVRFPFDISTWDQTTPIQIHLDYLRGSDTIVTGAPESFILGRLTRESHKYYKEYEPEDDTFWKQSGGGARVPDKYYYGLTKDRLEEYGGPAYRLNEDDGGADEGCNGSTFHVPGFGAEPEIYLTSANNAPLIYRSTGEIYPFPNFGQNWGDYYDGWVYGPQSPLIGTPSTFTCPYAMEHTRFDTLRLGAFRADVYDPDDGSPQITSYQKSTSRPVSDRDTFDRIKQNYIEDQKYTRILSVMKELTPGEVFNSVTEENIYNQSTGEFEPAKVLTFDFDFDMVVYRWYRPRKPANAKFYPAYSDFEYEEVVGFPVVSAEMYMINAIGGGRLQESPTITARYDERDYFQSSVDGTKSLSRAKWQLGYDGPGGPEGREPIYPDDYENFNGWSGWNSRFIGPQDVNGLGPPDTEGIKDFSGLKSNVMHIIPGLDPSLGPSPGAKTDLTINRSFPSATGRGYYYEEFIERTCKVLGGAQFGGAPPICIGWIDEYKNVLRHSENIEPAENKPVYMELQKITMPELWF